MPSRSPNPHSGIYPPAANGRTLASYCQHLGTSQHLGKRIYRDERYRASSTGTGASSDLFRDAAPACTTENPPSLFENCQDEVGNLVDALKYRSHTGRLFLKSIG